MQAQIVALGFNDPKKLGEQLDRIDPERVAAAKRSLEEHAGEWDADWLAEAEGAVA